MRRKASKRTTKRKSSRKAKTPSRRAKPQPKNPNAKRHLYEDILRCPIPQSWRKAVLNAGPSRSYEKPE